ncbi:MAG: hypothetical protein LT105_13430, partial [Lentimicrobium sp.]|nr:hypothetical protein [Lentimicrobium sp.]
KYVDPSGNELGVVAGYQGYGYYLGFANSNGIPWYAQYRTRKQNYLHMSRSNFMKLTGESNEVYNGIAANWKTGFTYTNGSYYYYGMPVTYNQVHNNYIIPGSEFNAKGNNASSFVNALNNSYGGNLALWVYSNVFGGNVAVLGNENKEPGLYGNDLTGYRSANAAYGVFYGVAGVIVGKGMGENNALGRGDNSEFNIENAVNYLNRNAYPKYDKATCGYCARAVRKSLEAGGINTSNRPNSAKDYGPYLQKWGFGIVERNGYTPLKGDIRVFQNYEGGSKHGHINMFNGNQWVSDFYENGFWPGRGYRENNAAFTIYRWDD